MNLLLKYRDTATFVRVSSGSYAGSKIVEEVSEVQVIFLQDTNFQHSGFQDGITADAVCYPDYESQFVVDNHNRLEGMYIVMNLYGSTREESWYKVISVATNRDHLLNNTQDNIELLLKKTEPVPGVS